MAALALVVGAVAVASSVGYSILPYSFKLDMAPEDEPPHMTRAEQAKVPRKTTRFTLPSRLPVLERFRPDPFNHTNNPQHNTQAARIHKDAILPAGFDDAYGKRLYDGTKNALCTWGDSHTWLLDPNLRVVATPALRIPLRTLDVTPSAPVCQPKGNSPPMLRRSKAIRHGWTRPSIVH